MAKMAGRIVDEIGAKNDGDDVAKVAGNSHPFSPPRGIVKRSPASKRARASNDDDDDDDDNNDP